ncbi:aminotransferase class V-fold PLP-dependent enzyme [Crenothrix polyspora]|uniref:Aminotransferase class V n=1 Tax=Crenothrix polyspora TaxID=360316 RepID=A0A1R4HIN1_9GAMM|nr:aminotransferase class V-fold PLP-dependent enzyme [Crenothrix polyspora]SJM96087.1 Aminotransferase class V [Crenothrix polyspora]
MLPLFPVVENCIYLNHAAVAPWPQPTVDALQQFAQQNLNFGASYYPTWLTVEQALREKVVTLLNADSIDNIALVKNTSEGLSFVAYGYPWHSGDNVVGIRQEFPSNRFVWQSLANKNVAFRPLDLQTLGGLTAEHALMALCDSHTRILAVSSVQYTTGLRLNLPLLGEFCRQHGILFCVDAIQQLGVIPFDVVACQADIVVADGHKWLMGPEGLAIFYVSDAARNCLQLTQYGWHMVEHSGDYQAETFTPAASARRFECGSPNMLGIHALNASLGLLLDTGIERIWRQVSAKIDLLADQLRQVTSVSVLSDLAVERRSGILTFTAGAENNTRIMESFKQYPVIAAERGGGIRLSPHFYTPDSQLLATVGVIAAAVF